jgi:hypothetical protein
VTELEAWNWLKSHYTYCLTKHGDCYHLNIAGMGEVNESTVLDCVIKMKELLNV